MLFRSVEARRNASMASPFPHFISKPTSRLGLHALLRYSRCLGTRHPKEGDNVIALTFFALFSLPSHSFKPLRLHDFTTLSLSLYPDNHSFVPFIYLPFHTSQEQDKMAYGLLLTIHYWYMRIGIAIVKRTLRRLGRPARRPSHELGSLVISALPRRA